MNFRANQIPVGVRLWNGVLSAFILVYGSVGLAIDAIFIPGKRSPGVILHGWAAAAMFGAIVAAAANMISVIVDHYDRRDNERDYRMFAKVSSWLGWALFIAAFVIAVACPGAGEFLRR